MVAAVTEQLQSSPLRVKYLGLSDYMPVWRKMQRFTEQRSVGLADELWLLEHRPVFTQGMKSKQEHLLDCGDIPVIAVDRGGQVTYHGPGQMVAYIMVDLRRLGLGIRHLVEILEMSVIDWLATQNVSAQASRAAPGVYVDGAKIAALGLRVRRGCSYHGLAFNVDMDLEPFTRINPCGYQGLAVTQLSDLGVALSVDEVSEGWLPYLMSRLDYTRNSD